MNVRNSIKKNLKYLINIDILKNPIFIRFISLFGDYFKKRELTALDKNDKKINY